MATTATFRAAAAAAPPRAFFSRDLISSSRRFAPGSSFLGNSGRRASSSDSWIRDKAAGTNLAPPPVKIEGCASLSDTSVSDKPLAVGATPAPSARGVYVPPALRKWVPVDTFLHQATAAAARAAYVRPALRKSVPMDTSLHQAAAAARGVYVPPALRKSVPDDTLLLHASAARADPSPSTPVDTSPSPDTPVPIVRAVTPPPPTTVSKSLPFDTPNLPGEDAVISSVSRTDLAVDTSTSPAACTDLACETSSATASCLTIETSCPDANKLPTVVASGSCGNWSPVLSSASYYAGSTFYKSPDPHMLPAPSMVMERLCPIDIWSHPDADLLVEEVLASIIISAKSAPALASRQDGITIADHASLSKSWVIDKLLATEATISASRAVRSDCCAPSTGMEECYIGPDPGHWSQFSSQQREDWGQAEAGGLVLDDQEAQ